MDMTYEELPPIIVLWKPEILMFTRVPIQD